MTIFRFSLRQALCSICLTGLVTASAQAQEYSHNPPLRHTGDWTQLFEQCSIAVAAEKGEAVDKSEVEVAINELACDAFVRGVWGGHETLVALKKVERQFCIPLEVPMWQVRRAVVAHMKVYQDGGANLDAAAAVLLALRFSWECKK